VLRYPIERFTVRRQTPREEKLVRVADSAIVRIILFCVTLATAVPLQAQVLTESFQGRDVVAGEIIVRFRAADLSRSRLVASQDADIQSTEAVGQSGSVVMHSRGRNVAALMQAYSSRPDVLYAEPNYVWSISDNSNDPLFGVQYALKNTGQSVKSQTGKAGADIQATEAWNITLGSRNVVVGIVDTGIRYDHPDLVANVWSAPAAFTVTISGKTIQCPAGSHGFNAITRTCDPRDDHYHGTHVAGIIGASGNNWAGVSGVSPVTSIMGLKFLNSQGFGSTTDAVAAIEFAIQVKAFFGSGANVRVLNNSWGGGGFSQALLDQINFADAADMLFVAAAGNAGSNIDDSVSYPASYNAPNIVAVAATDNRDALASFSNYGATSVHLGAPGVSVIATYPPATYEYLSGTSMASPMVAGAAALVLSSCSLTTVNLKDNLLESVDFVPGLFGKTLSDGRLNVNRALTNCVSSSGRFKVSVLQKSKTVPLNNAAAFSVTVNSINGFSDSVTLTATGLPPGMSASFSPAIIAGGSGSSTLTLTTSGTAAGEYGIGIVGTSGSLTHTRGAQISVGPPIIQEIVPSGMIAGMTVKTRIHGSAFSGGASAVQFSGTGILPTIGSDNLLAGLAGRTRDCGGCASGCADLYGDDGGRNFVPF
jgi:subtilisin family serine protease